jgi:ribosomal protein L27
MRIITRGHKEARRLTLKLVDGSLISGMINLIQRGETEHRVSDIFVGRHEPFVVVFKATMGTMTNKVLVINKHHIVWVIPEDEENAGRGQDLESTIPQTGEFKTGDQWPA